MSEVIADIIERAYTVKMDMKIVIGLEVKEEMELPFQTIFYQDGFGVTVMSIHMN